MLSVTVQGVVTGEPRSHAVPGGGRHVTLRLRSVDKDGCRFRVRASVVTVDDALAQSVSSLVHGDAVLVSGCAALRLSLSRDGQQHVTLKVKASQVSRLEPAAGEGAAAAIGGTAARPRGVVAAQDRSTRHGPGVTRHMGPSSEGNRAGYSTRSFAPVAGEKKGERLPCAHPDLL